MGADPGTRGEHALRRLPERDRDDTGSLGQPLAGAQEEWNACPSPVVDLTLQGDERLRLGFRHHARLVAVPEVLPTHDLGRLDGPHRAEHLVLLLADRAGLQRSWRFHRHEREHLEQVRHHHVSVRAGRFIERDALIERQRLRHVDLHMVDVIAVPDRLEQSVGESEGKNVLRRFLAEEVVDPEDLLLGKGFVQRRVEDAGTCEVGAERLLHDDARPCHEPRLAQGSHDGTSRIRRHAEVVEPTWFAAELALRFGHCGGEAHRSGVRTHVAEPPAEDGPLVRRDDMTRELVARVAREDAEAVVVEVFERRPHDAALRHEAGLGQVQQSRDELAARQIARGTEEHDDVRGQRRHQRWRDITGIGVFHRAPSAARESH